jgi:hypothetical protein
MSTRTTVVGSTSSSPRRARSRRRPLEYVVLVLVVIAVSVAVAVMLRPASAPLSMQVVPSNVADAIPGQSIVLLATFTDDGTVADPAEVTAEPLGYADQVAVSVVPERIVAGEVAEVTVVIDESVVADLPEGEPLLGQPVPLRPPDEGRQPVDPAPSPLGPEGADVPVRVTFTRGRTVQSTDVSINVSPGEDTLLEAATPLRDRFVAWLATEHPELDITPDTPWTPTIAQPHILVVSHYLFFSEEWEMGLMWHIMIAPHDWSRIYLRPRGGMTPTMAFEIPSVSNPETPIREIEVPAQIDR